MNATAQQMTSDQIIDLLDASGIDNYTRDLGSSGGGDWWGIEVPAPRNRFILITDVDAPFNAAADDDATEYVAICLYDSGDYEDLADCPWTYLGTEEITATPNAILDAVRALMAHAEVWDTTSDNVPAHECEWSYVLTDGPIGHGWECVICGEYQAG